MGEKNKKRFYLAHPFNSREYIKQWADGLKQETDIKIINPFYPKRIYEKYDNDDTSENEYYSKLDSKKIVCEDVKLIKKSHGLIGIIDGATSYGTIQEIVYAYLEEKIIYLIVTNNHHNHPWLKYHATKIFSSFESFEKWAKKNL